eukprot:s3812_g1.t1
MEAEVFAALCPVPGLATEVTMGFIAPLVLAAPVAATLRAPAGQACNFEASRLQLPGGRTLDFLLAGFFADCFVHADGRTISFNITRNIKALTSWTFFTIHAQILSCNSLSLRNPPPEELPYNAEQSLWRLDVGGFGASGKMQSPPLRTFQALELRELPFVYNATTRPLLLRFKAFSAVPAGGYVVVDAPPGVAFPEQCQGAVAGIPQFPEQPFRALSSEPLDLVASCSIDAAARSFRIALISGDLPAGIYELRFVITETDAFLPGPSLWRLESWRPEDPCSSCCSPRRSNFRSVIGLSRIEQLDVAAGPLELRTLGTEVIATTRKQPRESHELRDRRFAEGGVPQVPGEERYHLAAHARVGGPLRGAGAPRERHRLHQEVPGSSNRRGCGRTRSWKPRSPPSRSSLRSCRRSKRRQKAKHARCFSAPGERTANLVSSLVILGPDFKLRFRNFGRHVT